MIPIKSNFLLPNLKILLHNSSTPNLFKSNAASFTVEKIVNVDCQKPCCLHPYIINFTIIYSFFYLKQNKKAPCFKKKAPCLKKKRGKKEKEKAFEGIRAFCLMCGTRLIKMCHYISF